MKVVEYIAWYSTNTTVGDKMCRWETLLATGNNVGNGEKKKIKCFLATRISYRTEKRSNSGNDVNGDTSVQN